MESDVFVIPFCRRHSSPSGQNGQWLIHSWEGWDSPSHPTEPLAMGYPSSCPCPGQGGAAPGVLGWPKGQGSCRGRLTAAAGFVGVRCWGCPLQRQTSKLHFWLSLDGCNWQGCPCTLPWPQHAPSPAQGSAPARGSAAGREILSCIPQSLLLLLYPGAVRAAQKNWPEPRVGAPSLRQCPGWHRPQKLSPRGCSWAGWRR